MAQTPPPPIDALPEAPHTSSPATFSVLMDAFLAALIVFRTQLVAALNTAYSNAVDAFNSAGAAAISAQAAIGAANAVGWVSGFSYNQFDTVYSPQDGRTYRRLLNGAGTVDPSLDPTNWVCLNPVQAVPRMMIVTGSGPITIPASEFEVEIVGGPAGGSSSAFVAQGAAGGYVKKRYSGATKGAVGTVVIGSVGQGGSTQTAGTATSFTLAGFPTITAGGGTLTAPYGGTATGGDVNIPGQAGTRGRAYDYSSANGYLTSVSIAPGEGGSTPLGFGGVNGGAATGYGAGGSGTGAGSPGVMILRY